MYHSDFYKLQDTIGYKFNDVGHLERAFTHKSFVNEKTCARYESYERYEFLGDAILEFLTSEYLFNNYPNMSEGDLTKLRASLVCEFTLSKISRELHFGEYGRFSKGEMNTGGYNRDSILCDMFESVLGAIYIDGGIEAARGFVETFLLTDIEHKQLFYDCKSKLQEFAQKEEKNLSYELVGEYGPDHNKTFKVQVKLNDEPGAYGEGHTRKAAEQMAAFNTLSALQI